MTVPSFNALGFEVASREPEELREAVTVAFAAHNLPADVDIDFTPIPGDPSVGVVVRPVNDNELDIDTITRVVRSEFGTTVVPFHVLSGGDDDDVPEEARSRTWSLKLMGVLDAHAEGITGAGIRVGHMDTGYTDHLELHESSNPLRTNLGRDFVDGDKEARDRGKGVFHGHGTGTCSVLMSSVGNEMIGAAPQAEIIPYRVANTVVLARPRLRKNLARAIDDAVARNCKVISICLGWVWAGKALREAVANAALRGVLVIAAAGQLGRKTPGLRIVARPARLPGAIAVASCDHLRRASSFSGRGRRIDVTAPGEHIWRANVKVSNTDVRTSYGTSYSTAQVAGIAALWLQKWKDRPAMLASEGNSMRLALFRRMLRSSDLPPVAGTNKPHLWGAGIMDATRLLGEAPLEQESIDSIPSVDVWKDDVEEFTALIGELGSGDGGFAPSSSATRAALCDLFTVDGAQVDALLEDHIDELLVHMDANPQETQDLLRLVEGHAMAETNARLAPSLTPALFKTTLGPIHDKLRDKL